VLVYLYTTTTPVTEEITMVYTLPAQSVLVGAQLDEGKVVYTSTLYLGDQVEVVLAVRRYDGAVRAKSYQWGEEVEVFA